MFTSEGIHRLNYRAADASGRREATQTLTISLELTPPQIQTNLPVAITAGPLALTGLYTVTDAVSQVITLTVLLNDQPYQPTQPWHLGENTVDMLALNGAGLTAQRSQTITVIGGKIYLPLIEAR